MRSRLKRFAGAVTICAVIIVVSGSIGAGPWWIFSPLLVLGGIWFQRMGWQLFFFPAGLLGGLLAWGGMELLYMLRLQDIALHRLATQFGIPVSLLVIAAGLAAGIVAGLSLFTGKMLATESTWNIYPD